MEITTLERKANSYWNLVKSASRNEKLTLIALLSASLTNDEDDIPANATPAKARRLNALTDDEMEALITGEPQPFAGNNEANIQQIVQAHQGRIVKGMEKWL